MDRYSRMHEILDSLDVASYRHDQLMTAVFLGNIEEIDEVSTLPATVRKALLEELGPKMSSVEIIQTHGAPHTQKFLLQLEDGERIEAVLMQYQKGWNSLCVSSQVGCGLGCKFCATGYIGFRRNLTADEIVEQVLTVKRKGYKVDTVSFMGMGEPLANRATFEAIDILTDPKLGRMSPRRLNVSTVGYLPRLESLSHRFPNVNITYSLHTPFDTERTELIPMNRQYPTKDVLAFLAHHVQTTGRKVFLAYALFDGQNDSAKHVDGLIRLIRETGSGKSFHVNLIRYNGTSLVGSRYARTTEAKTRWFQETLDAAGINVSVRANFGDDIDAACGQLYARYD
jgi:23S rRNA (adenine-C8)-methyltransferase